MAGDDATGNTLTGGVSNGDAGGTAAGDVKC
jgi:hypothetical protein